jgi:hypothetical protein
MSKTREQVDLQSCALCVTHRPPRMLQLRLFHEDPPPPPDSSVPGLSRLVHPQPLAKYLLKQQIREPGLPGCGSLRYGHESRGTRYPKRTAWGRSGSGCNCRLVVSSETPKRSRNLVVLIWGFHGGDLRTPSSGMWRRVGLL